MQSFTAIFKNIGMILLFEIAIYTVIFILIETLYLSKDSSVAIRNSMTSVVVRLITLQILVQVFILGIALALTQNFFAVWVTMPVSYLLTYTVIRRELIPIDKLFGFGDFGNITPSFLVLILSSILAITIWKLAT